MNRNYLYIFPLMGTAKVAFSRDTKADLLNRGYNEQDKTRVLELVSANMVGNYCQVETGELIVQIAQDQPTG